MSKYILAALVLLAAVPAWAQIADGGIVYGTTATTTPQIRAYSGASNAFAGAAGTVGGAAHTYIVNKAAPTRTERVAGYLTTGGVLYIMRWDGTAWTDEWNFTVGGTGTNGRRFDIAYEQTSGDCVVLYSRNNTTTELGYRVWNGTAWTTETTVALARTTGIVYWVKMESRPGSDQLAMIASDATNDLTGMVWTGAAWGSEPSAAFSTSLEIVAAAGDVDDFDLAWESTSGDLLVAWADSSGASGTNGVRYATRTAAGTWTLNQTPATFADDATNLDLASDPGSDYILFASIGNGGSDLQYGAWSGAAWVNNTANADTGSSNPVAGSHMVECGWLRSGATVRGIVVYADAANATFDWSVYIPGTGWAMQADWTPGAAIGTERILDIDMDPVSQDRLMVTLADISSDLWAKRLVMDGTPAFTWSDSDGSAALTTTQITITGRNFDFDYDHPNCTAPVITAQPTNSAICAGANTTFTVTATGSSLTYQWQVNTGTWGNVTDGGVYSGATTSTLSITGATVGMNGYQYRCVVSSGVCNTTSNAATLTVNAAPTITVQPANSTVCAGTDTTFSVTATGAGLTYQWQVNTGAWGNVTDGGVYSGATTATLTLTGATAGMNGYQYRCVVSGTCTPTATSNAATLTISGTAPTITVQPANSTICAGADTTFSVTATGAGLTYQWQVNTGAWGNVTDGGVYSGATTAMLTITGATVGMSGYQYRCVVSSGGCPTTSNAALLTVNAAPAITAHPTDASGCETGNTSFSVTASGPGLAYQWQENQGSGWANVVNGGVYSGATTTILSLTGVTSAMNSYQYRCVVSGTCSPPATSNAATLNWTDICAVTPTTVVSNTVQISSCRQLTVTAVFTGDDDGDGTTKVEYNTTNTWPGTTACAALTGASPRVCLVTGLSPSPASYWVRVTHADPDGVAGTNPQALGAYAMPVCGSDQVAPTVTILNPGRDAILGGADMLKVQVFDGDMADFGTITVQWSVDGGALIAMTRNAAYNCDDPDVPGKCGVFEATLNTLATGTNPQALTNKKHYLTIQASDGTNTAVASRPFVVNNLGGSAVAVGTSPAGGGTLLRRTSGSQLCIDCHNLQTHSSQYTSTKNGNWAVDCQVCHVPHGTRNIHLVPEILQTLHSGAKAIAFQQDDRSGGTNPQNSYLGAYDGSGLPYDDGICEACHTKTNHYRNDASGGDHSHNRATRCVGCHAHADGFNAQESKGCAVLTQIQAQCSNCHLAIWAGMTDGAKVSKHLIGNTAGTNDSCTDAAVTWGPVLNTNAAAVRSCVNMCHPDHTHNLPSGTTHANNAHKDATTQASRGVTRDAQGTITAAATPGSPDATDFDNATTNGGLCLSCHRYPVEAGASPAHPAVDKATFNSSAHNGTSTTPGGNWTYAMHDASTFARNCTKCHAGDAEKAPAAYPFTGVHYSDNPALLAGEVNPAGTASSNVCYNCHGNGTTGSDYSGKNIATQTAKTRNHPADADAVHASTTEFYNAAFGNTLGVTGRHANCLDCHAAHAARAGTHATPGNLAGPPLHGAWGAQLSTYPAFWTDTASVSFTKKTIVAGTDLEATLCFKCHTRYYWGSGSAPTSPSGGFAETDVAKEFNPNNMGNFAGTWASGETAGGFHPVLATAGSNLGLISTTNLTTTGGFTWGTAGTNLMTCSDCHESNSTADPNGPHGSTANFILRGPNTTWSAAVVQSSFGMPAGTFCINCHSETFAGSRFTTHYSRDDHRVACWNCHGAIPHGGPRPGMIIAPAGAEAGVGGTIAGWDATAPYWGMGTSSDKLYIKSYPTNSTSNWTRPNCGCDGTGH